MFVHMIGTMVVGTYDGCDNRSGSETDSTKKVVKHLFCEFICRAAGYCTDMLIRIRMGLPFVWLSLADYRLLISWDSVAFQGAWQG